MCSQCIREIVAKKRVWMDVFVMPQIPVDV